MAADAPTVETGVRAATEPVEPIGFGTHRYKAGFKQVAPASAVALQQGGASCMLGVSMGNANFEGARLEASIEWLSDRFERCAIVLGDSVYRLTLELLEGLDEASARERAMREAAEFERLYAPLVRQYGKACAFEFIRFSDVERDPRFARWHQAMRDLAATDAGFARSIEEFAALYLGRGDKLDANPFAVPPERAAAIARAYLIEESALFCVLEEMGWPVLVYPGSIASIADLCEGRFAGTPAPLTRMAFVSLDLRKRGLHFADGAVKVIRSAADTSDLDRLGEGFLDDAEDADWNALLKATKLKRFAPREAIVAAGDTGRQLFILLDGRAEVSVRRGDGSHQQIAVIEDGSVFGEQAFLDGQPRSATVSAINECEVRSLAWRDFLAFREKHPLVACDILADIGRTLSLRGRRQLRELQHLP